MASDPLMAFALIGLGVRQLSVAPRAVPLVKRLVRTITAAAAEAAAAEAMQERTASAVNSALSRRLVECCGDDPFLHDGLPVLS
jgi:signal transduction protein with GAF and PtsI domain